MWRKKRVLVLVVSLCLALVSLGIISHALAAPPTDNGFSLEVSPSPLIKTVKPGQLSVIDLRIHNRNTVTEQLKVELKKFSVKDEKGAVQLSNDAPVDVTDWVTIQEPRFSIKSGEWYTQKINVDTPTTAGFSYNFAIVISRQNPTKPVNGKTAINGKVAVLTLLAVDRPGANRKFEVQEFSADHRVYEYLPANLTLRVKNIGNTIVQPTGNIYIQRTSNSQSPMQVLKVNESGSYILPGTTRNLSTEWSDGFPVFMAKKDAANSDTKLHLEWSWGKANHFRIGKYVAKLVAIYNDGQRDIPIQTEVSFWVIPWKVLIALVVLIVILVVGFSTLTKGVIDTAKKRKKSIKRETSHSDSNN